MLSDEEFQKIRARLLFSLRSEDHEADIENNNAVASFYESPKKINEETTEKEVFQNKEMLTNLFKAATEAAVLPNFTNIVTFETVPSFNSIHNEIQQKMNEIPNNFKQCFHIYSIETIHNPYLLTMYNLKKSELEEVYGARPSERNLFHGASDINVQSICENNFNYRLCGISRGTKYGKGISFSPDFWYAKWFCDKRQLVKTILYCKVLIGRTHIGHESTNIPMEGFDTTQRDNGQVLVKYNDDVFYPEYRIRFVVRKRF